jgi:hypothetical protein
MRQKLISLLAVLAIAILAPSAANATLIGDTVGCSVTTTLSLACDTATATVIDPGAEFSIDNTDVNFSEWNVDIFAESIFILYVAASSNTPLSILLTLSDLDWVSGGQIVGIENFDTDTSMTLGDISFTADSVSIQLGNGIGPWIGSPGGNGTYATFDLVTVPEPTALTLVGLGLAGLGFARGKKPRQSRCTA